MIFYLNELPISADTCTQPNSELVFAAPGTCKPLRSMAVHGTEVGADCSPVFHRRTAQTSVRQVCAASVANLRGYCVASTPLVAQPVARPCNTAPVGCSRELRRRRIDTPLRIRSGRGGVAFWTCAQRRSQRSVGHSNNRRQQARRRLESPKMQDCRMRCSWSGNLPTKLSRGCAGVNHLWLGHPGRNSDAAQPRSPLWPSRLA